jgi:hypothetical protein
MAVGIMLNASAPEFVPESIEYSSHGLVGAESSGLNPLAARFAPRAEAVDYVPFGRNANLSNLAHVQKTFANIFSRAADDSAQDDWSTDDSIRPTLGKTPLNTQAVEYVPFGTHARLSHLCRVQKSFTNILSHASDDSAEDADWSTDDEIRPMLGKSSSRESLSSMGSTSVGMSSNDDDEECPTAVPIKQLFETALAADSFRHPPGLSLPSSPCRYAVEICEKFGYPEDQPLQDLPQEDAKDEKLRQQRPWLRTSSSYACNGAGYTPPWRRTSSWKASALSLEALA